MPFECDFKGFLFFILYRICFLAPNGSFLVYILTSGLFASGRLGLFWIGI